MEELIPVQEENQEEALQGPETPAPGNSQPEKTAIFISIIIIALLILFAFAQKHLAEVSAAASNIGMGILAAGCLYLVVRYFRQIKNAAILAKRGNQILAKKTAIEAFIPMLGSVNLAVYNFLNSEIVQKYAESLRDSGTMIKGWLTELSPDKGLYIYYGGIAVLVILLNGAAVKGFRKALRVARILGA